MSSIDPKTARFETRAIHAGQSPNPENGALMTPVYLNSTYAQPAPGEPIDGYEYSRTTNPTRTSLERNLASLEGAAWGLCFASGMSAIDSLCARLSPGDHVVAGLDLYGGTYRLFTKKYQRFGIEFSFVDTTDVANVAAAICDRTKYVYVETPSNPLLGITDIAACAELAKKAGCPLVVDNTFASPFLQSPLELGADLVLHSCTKYLGGHSDAVAGAIVGNDEGLREEIAFYQNSCGGQLGPLSSFLILRGTKTLALRMERHSESAMAIAKFLEGRDEVEKVIYPGLASHPGHEVAKRQMRHFGGMVSFELKTGVPGGKAFSMATRVFPLVEVPPIMTHASIPAAERRAAGMADGLVRLSVGVEHIDDLLADVERGLVAAAAAVEPAATA
ncbi:MAG: aminotransferase class I/II-fold pyridoxal phosphate-dependent enzyme [Planctomycetota bacterium]|nr:aminotransferase class I/II-fold pyridoxal phosphate-dependent enzyme [Planctomycetota bacterium]